MKYYLIAGEASGDLHGANLVHYIKLFDNNAEIRAWGGIKLKKEGAAIVTDIDKMSFMGFSQTFFGIKKIFDLLRYCKSDISKFKPDVVVLVDYPGFNLRIAKFAKQKNIKTVFYISPQIWAWHHSRVYKIKRYIDIMIPILPFEVEIYKKYNVNVHYFGNPLIDELAKYKDKLTLTKNEHVAMLPGSRKSEIAQMLPVFVEVAKMFPDEKFILACMSIHDNEYYLKFMSKNPPDNIQLVVDKTYEIISNAKAAIVTSGTATLETAILKVPQVVCYKTNKLSFLLARILSKVKFISLTNLILNKQLIKELIQHYCTKYSIAKELKKLINDKEYRQFILDGYEQLYSILKKSGASYGAAKLIVEEVTNNCHSEYYTE